ncbi:MAG TPA: hypothetical protein VGH77_05895, partial [Streptosporangiaceae bacterium]
LADVLDSAEAVAVQQGGHLVRGQAGQPGLAALRGDRRELARAGLSCNVIAGYHHDHLFVPHDRSAEAVTVLEALARRAAGDDRPPG